MNENDISRAASVMSQSTASITTDGIEALFKVNEKRRQSAVVLATGAVFGAAQVLASVIGDGPDGCPGRAVTDDSILIALLLASVSGSVSPAEKSPDHAVTVEFEQEPTSYLRAFEMYERLTGRKAESVLHPDVMAYATQGVQAGTDLLNQVCANRRPS